MAQEIVSAVSGTVELEILIGVCSDGLNLIVERGLTIPWDLSTMSFRFAFALQTSDDCFPL